MTLEPQQVPNCSPQPLANVAPSSESGTGRISHTGRPTTSPSSPQANSEPVSPPREVYKSRGLLDPNYVFSKPPRPQRLRSPSEKHKKDRPATSRYPLSTSTYPAAKPSA